MLISNSYSLKKFKNSHDLDIEKALKIYTQNIDSAIRTDTKEILYWLDNYQKEYKDLFFVFGFYIQDEIVGYAELAYFQEEKLLIVDYLVIDKLSRKNNTFFEFIEQIKEYYYKQNFELDYIIGEIACYNEINEPPPYARNLIRLFKLVGFGVIKAQYYSPMLGKDNFESEMNSILILNTLNNKINKIKKETFIYIIKTIYYKHYLRWYKAFLKEEEFAEYTNKLNILYGKITNTISKKKYIDINGYQHLFSEGIKKKKDSTFKKTLQIAIGIILFISLTILIGSIYLFINKKYNLNFDIQSNIIIASLIITFSFLSTLWSSKKGFLLKLIEKIIKKI